MLNTPPTQGITWKEVLAVACILSVIAAMLFPVFARPHGDRSYRAQCQSNLKQLGIGLVQYLQDYDEQLPAIGANGTGWAYALYPYEKSTGVFKCPNDTLVATTSAYPESYALNANLTQASGQLAKYRKQENFTNVALTVLAFETDGATLNMTDDTEIHRPAPYRSPVGNGLSPVPGTPNLTSGGLPVRYASGDIGARGCAAAVCPIPTRHDPSGFYLAADGHVKLLRPEKVSSGNPPPKSGPQSGNAFAGTAATTDTLGSRYTLTFSPK